MIKAGIYEVVGYRYMYLCMMLLFCVGLSAQENCNNNIDDDGDGMIDCFDPDCCTECIDHYFFDCDTICSALQLKDSIVLRTLWRQTMDWDRRNTPLVGQLSPGQTSVIGLSDSEFSSTANRDILVINGQDGSINRRIMTAAISNYAQSIGMADLNNDGQGEIVVGLSSEAADARRITCYNNTGSILWDSDEPYGYSDADVNMSPQFADFDQDGNAEIYVGNQIFNGQNGNKYGEGGAGNNVGRQSAKNPLYRFYASTAADVLPSGFCADCDGLELIAGNQVYSVNLSTGNITVVAQQADSDFGDGLTSLADMNGDGDLDVVVAQRINDFVNIWVWDPGSGALLSRFTYSYPNPGNLSGGSSVPLLTDIDLDGDVDVVFSTSERLLALANDGSGGLSPAWTVRTNDISGRSGPVAFDFDGNGVPEIVHRGADFLRVIDAADGEVLDSLDCYSPTFFDKAIVADVDNDPGAEIICSCGNELRAFTSGYSQWSNTRPVWNQMHYYNTHIEDNLNVPRYMQSHHLPELNGRYPLNSYLEQYSQPEKPTSDLHFENFEIFCSGGEKFLSVDICNKGDIRVPDNIHISIYTQDPTVNAATPAWSDLVPELLARGECRSYQYAYTIPDNIDTVYLTVNVIPDNSIVDTLDDSDFVALECRYDNNIELFDVSPYHSTTIDLGADTTLCPEESFTLDAGNDHYLYLWSDSSENETFFIDEAGVYALTVTDDCGNTAEDEIMVDYVNLPDPGLPNDSTLCLGDTLIVSTSEYDSVFWYLNNDLICKNCDELLIQALDAGTILMQAWINGCVQRDSFELEITEAPSSRDTVLICPGDSVLVGNEWVRTGTYTNSYNISGPCDSVAITYVMLGEEINFTYTVDTLCQAEEEGSIRFSDLSTGLSINWDDGSSEFNRNDLNESSYGFTIVGEGGCELRDTISVERYPHPISSMRVQTPGCRNDSLGSIELNLISETYEVMLNGNSLGSGNVLLDELDAGSYSITVLYESCRVDTTIIFDDINYDSLLQDTDIEITYGDSVLLGVELSGLVEDPVWDPSNALSCTDCLPAIAFPEGDRTYTLTGVDSLGCPVEKEYRIIVDRQSVFYMPNIFTPNSDGVNDQLVFHSNIPLRSLDQFVLYDRWGEQVMEANNLSGREFQLWEGTFRGRPAPQGVYVYYIRLTDISGKVYELTGDVTLVR